MAEIQRDCGRNNGYHFDDLDGRRRTYPTRHSLAYRIGEWVAIAASATIAIGLWLWFLVVLGVYAFTFIAR